MRERMMSAVRDERGIAIITALLVSMIVVTLGATSVTLAIHNSEASSYDRRRVQVIAAAEAGVNYYFSHLQSEPSAATVECSIQRTLDTTPATSFDATVTFFDAAGNELPDCPPATEPASALIHSEGTTNANATPTRTMEASVNLLGEPASPFGDSVVFSNNSIKWAANVQIQGADASNSNVYSNGDITLSSASIVYGSLYAQGSITLNGNAQVRRDAWANNQVTLNNNSSVGENGISSTSSITVNNKARIYQDATACTTVTAGRGAIGGRITTGFCPPAQTPPPEKVFPTYTFDPNPWIADGYTINTFSGTDACTTAKSFIKNIGGGSQVVRITEDCLLDWNKDAPGVRGNLAIISDGGMNVKNTTWTAEGGPWNLHLMFGIDDDGQPCDITFGPGSGVGANLSALMYTPCTISLASNVSINEGQLIGGTVSLAANSGIRYKQVPVPGYATAGYEVDVLYVREVVTGA